MSSTCRVCGVAAITMLILCCGRKEESQSTLSAMRQKYPCTAIHPAISLVPNDSLTDADRCSIVIAAMRELGRVKDTVAGLRASDTLSVVSAAVTPLTFRDTTGQMTSSYWSVDLALKGRSNDVMVQIDRRTGAMKASAAHKPF